MSTKHGPSQRGPHCVLNDLGYNEHKKLWALLFQRKLQSFLNNAFFLLLTDSLPSARNGSIQFGAVLPILSALILMSALYQMSSCFLCYFQ